MENDLLTWAYWGQDKSEIIRNLGLVLIAAVGLPFIIWRSFAAHRTSKAALATSQASLKQSEASLKQSEASLKQAEVANKQADAALRQSKNAEQQTELLVKNQFLEYLIKGFENLSSDNPNIRIGAVYILERLAETSDSDRYPILKALQLYVKSASELPYSEFLERSGIDEKTLESIKKAANIADTEDLLHHLIPESQKKWPRPVPDIQAIMEILGGRIRKGPAGKNKVFLSGVDISGVSVFGLDFSDCSLTYSDLSGIRADGASFQESNLFSSILIGASLRESNLLGASLQAAKLTGADLEKADLSQALLWMTDFERASLRNANLTGAVLEHTNLCGANLTGALGLNQSQLDNAYGNSKTILPDGYTIREKDLTKAST